MIESWEKYKLKELYSIPSRNGLTKPSKIRGEGVKMVNMGEIFAHDRIRNIKMERVPLSEKEKQNYLLEVGDLLFARQSLVISGAGKCSIFLGDEEEVTFESHLIRTRFNSQLVLPAFVYYYFKSFLGRKKMASIVEVTAAAGIRGSDLAEISIEVPKIECQNAIVSLLTALDDKVEVNYQMNQTLERMAQTIFKEWFLNFNFPGFDGVLVDSIPKGWRMGKVGDVCYVNRKSLSQKDSIDTIDYIEISEVSRGKVNKISTYVRGEEPSRARRKLAHGDTVLSTVRPDRGSFFLALNPHEKLVASTGFAVFTPTSVPFSFLYCFLTDDEQLAFYGKMASGAAYPAINPSLIMNLQLIIPPADLLQQFHAIAGELYYKLHENLNQAKTLIEIRDSLLTKLISGKIQIEA